MQPSSKGGHSTLMDGFEAIRRLQEQSPDDYELLTRTPILTQRYDPDHAEGELPRWYQCRLPMIQLDADGDIS
jgi:gamma-butyrobetaine dioxygenase